MNSPVPLENYLRAEVDIQPPKIPVVVETPGNTKVQDLI
jgi:hypothetical protein